MRRLEDNVKEAGGVGPDGAPTQIRLHPNHFRLNIGPSEPAHAALRRATAFIFRRLFLAEAKPEVQRGLNVGLEFGL